MTTAAPPDWARRTVSERGAVRRRPAQRDACFAAGKDDYVAKPIRPNELAEALHRARPLRAH